MATKENQVTVRFESTVETNESDRLSYVPIQAFIEFDSEKDFSDKEKYYIIRGNEYVKTYSPSIDRNDGRTIYVKNPLFDMDNGLYYIKNNNEYIEADPDDYYIAGLQFFYIHESFLMSGPVEIFATLDVVRSENGIAHPTLDEIKSSDYKVLIDGEMVFDIDKYSEVSGLPIALESPYITNLVYDYMKDHDRNVIIYVENVTNFKDQNRYRGAYFAVRNISEDQGSDVPVRIDWQEIILGTHSHSNMKVLEDISELAYSGSEGYLTFDKDGNILLKDFEEVKKLPDLPYEVRKKLEELDKYKKLNEPEHSEDAHLDASFDLLTDTYDWMKGSNTVVGNCRDLYRSLLKSDRKMYIDNNFKLVIPDVGEKHNYKYWVSLDVFKVNFDPEKKQSDAVQVKVSPFSENLLLLNLELSSNLFEEDEILLFKDEKLLDKYSILDRKLRSLSLTLDKTYDAYKDVGLLTVLVVRNAKTVENQGYKILLENAFANETLSIGKINTELTKLYIEGEFARKPKIPKLYLSTDEYGSLVWENKLLPSQTFYAKTITVTSENLEKVVRNEREYVKLVFENANYDLKNDFPMLTVNDFFIFSAKPDLSESGKDVVYYLPLYPIIGEGQYDFELVEPNEYRNVTLVLIKNSASGALKELAENYVTKEDAINILSKGKISLKDYATKNELLGFTKLGHTHSQYALKEHNHDSRYANFQHTHPEMVVMLTKLFNEHSKNGVIEEKVVDYWLTEMSDRTDERFKQFLEEVLGLTYDDENTKGYYFADLNVKLSNKETVLAIKKKANTDLGAVYNLENSTLYLDEAIELLVKFFEKDTVTDSQVLLHDDIPVRLVNGPVGGIETAKIYKAGETSLQDILRDILNPYISIDEMKKRLTPNKDYIVLKWYLVGNEDDELTEIDISRFPVEKLGSTIALKIELDNEYKLNCKEKVLFKDDYSIELKYIERDIYSEVKGVYIDGEPLYLNNGYYYKNNVESLETLEIEWKTNRTITDNYGNSEDNELVYLSGTVEDNNLGFELDYPNIMIGTFTDKNINLDIFDTKVYSEKVLTKLTVDEENPFILVAVEFGKKYRVIDMDTHTDITNYFEVDTDSYAYEGKSYTVLSYESYIDSDLKIMVTTKEG